MISSQGPPEGRSFCHTSDCQGDYVSVGMSCWTLESLEGFFWPSYMFSCFWRNGSNHLDEGCTCGTYSRTGQWTGFDNFAHFFSSWFIENLAIKILTMHSVLFLAAPLGDANYHHGPNSSKYSYWNHCSSNEQYQNSIVWICLQMDRVTTCSCTTKKGKG